MEYMLCLWGGVSLIQLWYVIILLLDAIFMPNGIIILQLKKCKLTVFVASYSRESCAVVFLSYSFIGNQWDKSWLICFLAVTKHYIIEVHCYVVNSDSEILFSLAQKTLSSKVASN